MVASGFVDWIALFVMCWLSCLLLCGLWCMFVFWLLCSGVCCLLFDVRCCVAVCRLLFASCFFVGSGLLFVVGCLWFVMSSC